MEKHSTNYGTTQNWVKKVIISCENHKQLMSANRLQNLFIESIDRKIVTTPFFNSIREELRNEIDKKSSDLRRNF